MAILWQKSIDDTMYQVRNAGKTMRLYTNGILHTEYNPNHILTGSVWDLLLLGSFLVPIGHLKRVLVLGVGGGAVLNQIHYFFPKATITGVELNPTHLRVAKDFFALNTMNHELIEADAIDWVNTNQNRTYDLIIEDLFCETDGEPERVKEANKSWVSKLDGMLSPSGVMVVNFIDRDSLLRSSTVFQETGKYASGLRFTTKNCFNIVAVYSRKSVLSSELLQRLREYPLLDSRKKACKLHYNVRKLF